METYDSRLVFLLLLDSFQILVLFLGKHWPSLGLQPDTGPVRVLYDSVITLACRILLFSPLTPI